MKKLSTVSWNTRRNTAEVGTIQTGAHCPLSAFWQPADGSAEAIFIAEGSIMPSSGGREAKWALASPVPLHGFAVRARASTGRDNAPASLSHAASKFHVSQEKILDRPDHSA
jgi:hypothetical protein